MVKDKNSYTWRNFLFKATVNTCLRLQLREEGEKLPQAMLQVLKTKKVSERHIAFEMHIEFEAQTSGHFYQIKSQLLRV